MDSKRKGPVGIELVKRGILTQSDIDKALEYQRNNPELCNILSEIDNSICEKHDMREKIDFVRYRLIKTTEKLIDELFSVSSPFSEFKM